MTSLSHDDDYVVKGIEAVQRSTPPVVADAQRDLIRTLGRTREAAAVCDRLRVHLRRLRRGDVAPEALTVTSRLSKPPGEYRQRTRTVAAARRAERRGLNAWPGESLRFVVVDDDAAGPERVRLPFEDDADACDVDCYDVMLRRAAVSVVSPLGWDRVRVDRHLRRERDGTLADFG